ncbi:unnamed protein product [Dracunculus medinensis]|uniref:Beta-lactamase domain-containing protein n=1 Tax=Dracunculus medinensis TaxID=318479 RepID=A0A0N4UJV2_DRAME|nr:unnamed protein product [Dracunculus medinensis]
MASINCKSRRDDIPTDGFTHPSFALLKEVFKRNFEMNLEPSGAAFAAYHRGKLVADLYGGYSDKDKKLPWREETMTILFSTTKSLASICLAILIDRGKASYDDLVCKYWPKFANNGKGCITIKQVVQHEAGLPYDNQILSVNDVLDHERMAKFFERMTPLWQPGEKCGYHALTFGFLVDQLVRRLDDKKRGVVEFFHEEIVSKHGLNGISIGLENDEQNDRVAYITSITDEQIKLEAEQNPEGARKYKLADNIHNKKLYESWPWIQIHHYNKLENRRIPMASNMGIGTARDLAKVHSLIVEGKLLSERFLRQIQYPQLDEMDIINGYPENKGFGWIYNKNTLGNWNFGHSGYGGQNVRVDLDSKLAYAYICSGLKAADADNVRPFANLQACLYECLKKNCS